MLIAYMKETVPQVLNEQEQTDLSHLVGWYKSAKQRFDTDPDFKKRSQLEVVALQGGDPEALKAWEIICEISRKINASAASGATQDQPGIRLRNQVACRLV